ncbi:MAG: transporter associated domain-containing protein [Candidatus Paracaedibacteraceae bacterium]|nr:transporter associated domain-containing protein [Candidatus Paracaedibacteraceae bacterium]
MNAVSERYAKTYFGFIKRFWRYCRKGDHDTSVRETIEELIEEADEDFPSIESDERLLLGNVLNLRDLTAHDIMVPRADIIAVPNSISEVELLEQFVKTGISWIVVYKDNLDHVVGMIQIKDVLAWLYSQKPFMLKALLKEVMFISPAMRTLDLLLTMRESGLKVAIVVDEYGGVDGLVTFSQLIEEIIGDIEDTSDQSPSPQLNWRSDGAIIADGRCTFEELDELAGKELDLIDDDEDIDTLSGLITFLAGRVPSRGELITHPKGIEFEILDADPRRVKRLCIRHIPSITSEPIKKNK